jgi:hypothetical protein
MSGINSSVKVPQDLKEASLLRAEAMGYPSWGSYITALLREDLIRRGEHPHAARVARMRPHHRDQIDAEILARCREEHQPAPANLLALTAA